MNYVNFDLPSDRHYILSKILVSFFGGGIGFNVLLNTINILLKVETFFSIFLWGQKTALQVFLQTYDAISTERNQLQVVKTTLFNLLLYNINHRTQSR